jgi:dihydrofolate reductase
MGVSLIVAISENRAIGLDNKLLWHLPADMAFFKEKTTGHHIITGRKNYESIPERFRPLPNRVNIVLSRDVDFKAPGALIFNNLKEAIDFAISEGEEEVFIIGGGFVYAQALEEGLVDKMYITYVNELFEGDTFFPEFSREDWMGQFLFDHAADGNNPYSFEVWEYVKYPAK